MSLFFIYFPHPLPLVWGLQAPSKQASERVVKEIAALFSFAFRLCKCNSNNPSLVLPSVKLSAVLRGLENGGNGGK